MLSYKAPLRDMRFVREELLDFPGLYASLPGYETWNGGRNHDKEEDEVDMACRIIFLN